MTDRQLLTALRSVLLAGVAARGFTGFAVLSARQPTTQGARDVPTLYLSRIGETVIGQTEAAVAWDAETLEQRQTAVQRWQATYQISAWGGFDPADPAAIRPADLIRAARDSVRGPDGLDAWQAAGVRILDPSPIRLASAVDDRGQWQDNPSFDLPILHSTTLVRTIPATETTDYRINRV